MSKPITDKHGNPLRSVHSERINYVMTMDELQSLMRATHDAQSEMEARINTRKVWKKMAEKYNFILESVHRPLGTDNPRTFSAIPDKPKDDEDISQE